MSIGEPFADYHKSQLRLWNLIFTVIHAPGFPIAMAGIDGG
jgi:hypothetical protein